MRRLTVLVLCLVLALATSAVAAAPPQTSPAMTRFQRDLVNVLALRAEAKPLLGAALLARTLPDPPDYISYHALLQRAAHTPDAGPAITWAQLVDCKRQAMDCPHSEALAALTQQAPDNAAVWLMVLGQADRHGDDAKAQAALVKAAAAERYDDYLGISLEALANAAGTLPPPSGLYDGKHSAATSAAGVRALLVFGLGSLQPMPGFHAAARMCEQGKDDAATRATCLDLAKTLVWGSAPLARSLGLHLRQTLSQDPDVRRQAEAAWRDLAWQVHNFGKLTLKAPRDADLARHLLHLARQGGTQMSLILAALRGAHIPVDAPAGWQPSGDTPARASSSR